MALAATVQKHDESADVRDVIDFYRTELAKPAPPRETFKFPPVLLGPTWQTTPDGHWLLPERTLGWDCLGWTGLHLQQTRGTPWVYTLEQARLLLWWMAVDEDGVFLSRDAILQRLKGWGKDPFGATLCALEMNGPVRFSDEWKDGQPVGREVDEAWIQTAATALEQTKNTMRLFPQLYTEEAKSRYGIVIGKEIVHASGGRMIQAVTSSPATLEGARASFVLKNETQHWLANNDGHEMAAVISRNATKSSDGAARTMAITNAYEPSAESVAQRDREAYDLAADGGSLTTGILYDSIEAPPEAPLTAEDAPEVVRAIRGDSIWLNIDRIVKSILDTREPASRSRRYWYNQIVAAEDAWLDPQEFDALKDTEIIVSPRDEVVLFFDGSKSDDATGLVGCRLSDGHVFTLGMWQKPPGPRGDNWTAPRASINLTVRAALDDHNVVAFYADPSHTLDDETQERYWDDIIDGWHRDYKHRFDPKVWAVPGVKGHSIMWDMVSSQRTAEFTAACELVESQITTAAKLVRDGKPPTFTWDGDGRLRRHAHNARRFPNKFGVSIWKGHRESPKKIDLAVCMVGARMLRRIVLNTQPAKKRSGKVWGA